MSASRPTPSSPTAFPRLTLVGQPGQRGADPVRRAPCPRRRRAGRHRQHSLGDQYVARLSGFQLALASQLTRSPDITAVVGQHVHIVQPIRILNGKLVVFGEGNLISNQTSACCPAASQDGMIVLLTITVDSRGARATFIRYVPIWVRHPDFVGSRPAPPGAPTRRRRSLRASYERTVRVPGAVPDPADPADLLSAGCAWITLSRTASSSADATIRHHETATQPLRPTHRQTTASAVSRTGRYGAGWPGRPPRSWHAWRTGTPARLAAARM